MSQYYECFIGFHSQNLGCRQFIYDNLQTSDSVKRTQFCFVCYSVPIKKESLAEKWLISSNYNDLHLLKFIIIAKEGVFGRDWQFNCWDRKVRKEVIPNCPTTNGSSHQISYHIIRWTFNWEFTHISKIDDRRKQFCHY